MTDKAEKTDTSVSHSNGQYRKVVSRDGAAIRVDKTELTGALKQSLTGGSGSFGERTIPKR